jgi:hypothetical protein
MKEEIELEKLKDKYDKLFLEIYNLGWLDGVKTVIKNITGVPEEEKEAFLKHLEEMRKKEWGDLFEEEH